MSTANSIFAFNIYTIKKNIRPMIKKFKQFNEELSPELLKRAAKSAYDREQRVRGDRF